MPDCAPVCNTLANWWVFPSRIRLLTAAVAVSTSKIATRPPPGRLISFCAITACRLPASWART